MNSQSRTTQNPRAARRSRGDTSNNRTASADSKALTPRNNTGRPRQSVARGSVAPKSDYEIQKDIKKDLARAERDDTPDSDGLFLGFTNQQIMVGGAVVAGLLGVGMWMRSGQSDDKEGKDDDQVGGDPESDPSAIDDLNRQLMLMHEDSVARYETLKEQQEKLRQSLVMVVDNIKSSRSKKKGSGSSADYLDDNSDSDSESEDSGSDSESESSESEDSESESETELPPKKSSKQSSKHSKKGSKELIKSLKKKAAKKKASKKPIKRPSKSSKKVSKKSSKSGSKSNKKPGKKSRKASKSSSSSRKKTVIEPDSDDEIISSANYGESEDENSDAPEPDEPESDFMDSDIETDDESLDYDSDDDDSFKKK